MLIFNSKWLVLLTGLALTPLYGTDLAYLCPTPSSISTKPVPRSWNSVYWAEVEDLGFFGYDMAGIPIEKLHFVSAEISEVNDYWRFACNYSDGSLHLSIATDESAFFKACFFTGEQRSCTDSREACVLGCAESPIELHVQYQKCK